MEHSLGVLDVLRSQQPQGPRDRDLESLDDLAIRLAVLGDVDLGDARRTVVHALQGRDGFAGLPPSALPIYRRFVHGPELLSSERPPHEGFHDGLRPLSDRDLALSHIALGLWSHARICDVPAGVHEQPAGRFLAVVRVDANVAFGLAQQDPGRESPTVRTEPDERGPALSESIWRNSRGGWTEEVLDEWRRLRKEGWADTAIAKHYRCSRQRVVQKIGPRDHGLKKAQSKKANRTPGG